MCRLQLYPLAVWNYDRLPRYRHGCTRPKDRADGHQHNEHNRENPAHVQVEFNGRMPRNFRSANQFLFALLALAISFRNHSVVFRTEIERMLSLLLQGEGVIAGNRQHSRSIAVARNKTGSRSVG